MTTNLTVSNQNLLEDSVMGIFKGSPQRSERMQQINNSANNNQVADVSQSEPEEKTVANSTEVQPSTKAVKAQPEKTIFGFKQKTVVTVVVVAAVLVTGYFIYRNFKNKQNAVQQ